VNPKAIEEGKPEKVTETARAYVEIVAKFRAAQS
jgi:hypothetical protein